MTTMAAPPTVNGAAAMSAGDTVIPKPHLELYVRVRLDVLFFGNKCELYRPRQSIHDALARVCSVKNFGWSSTHCSSLILCELRYVWSCRCEEEMNLALICR